MTLTQPSSISKAWALSGAQNSLSPLLVTQPQSASFSHLPDHPLSPTAPQIAPWKAEIYFTLWQAERGFPRFLNPVSAQLVRCLWKPVPSTPSSSWVAQPRSIVPCKHITQHSCTHPPKPKYCPAHPFSPAELPSLQAGKGWHHHDPSRSH